MVRYNTMPSQTIRVLRIMTIVKFVEAMGTPLDIAHSKNTPLYRTQFTVSYVGPLLTPPNNVVLWMRLRTN